MSALDTTKTFIAAHSKKIIALSALLVVLLVAWASGVSFGPLLSCAETMDGNSAACVGLTLPAPAVAVAPVQ